MKHGKAPMVVGLTGGIGSGKSAAAEMFAQRGITIIDTDAISRELTAAHGTAMPTIKQQFGADYIHADGALNRERMREIIFSDAGAKKKLEAILHPMIKAETLKRIQAATSPYVILAVPLLFETGGYAGLIQTTLVIDCNEDEQVRRTSARSGMTPAQVKAIMAAQLSRTERLKKADHVIDNNGSLQTLAEQVNRLHEKFLQQAK
jgi:dephospho-CoA kinase